jgi:hypothetical protein
MRWRELWRKWTRGMDDVEDADAEARKSAIRSLAIAALVDVGALDQCTKHGTYFVEDYFDQVGLVPAAIRATSEKIKNGTIELPKGTPVHELMATIVGIHDEFGFYNRCPECGKKS